jgi:GntR family transcriptional regulator, transcriptional repressor for pyruvate dehydrogenase complex
MPPTVTRNDRIGAMAAGAHDAGDGHLFSEVVREPTLSDKVAASITEAIVSGHLKPHERLQSERELGERFGVSRTVIREAIRSLAAHGLVESVSGRGVSVAQVGPETVSRSMTLFLRGNSSIDYAKVHEVRMALEVEMSGTAAERAGDEDIARLHDLLQQMREAGSDPGRAAALDLEFHGAIATATQNELFAVMLDSIGDVLRESRMAAFQAGMLEYAVGAHAEILGAIELHDAEAAREAMRRHLDRSRELWSSIEV